MNADDAPPPNVDAGTPPAPTRHEAIENAAHAIRGSQSEDRDEILAAQRALRTAGKAHDRAVRDAERELAAVRRRGEDTADAEERLAAARSDRRGCQEARPLLHHLAELVDEGEDVLDMTPALTSGHDGIVVITDRRIAFLALRRQLSFPYAELRSIAASGRFFGSKITVADTSGRAVFGGLRPRRAQELVAEVEERRGAPVTS